MKYILIDIDNTLFPFFYMIKAIENEAQHNLIDKDAFAEIKRLLSVRESGEIGYLDMGYRMLYVYAQAVKGKNYHTLIKVDRAFAEQNIDQISPLFRELIDFTKQTKDTKIVLITSEPAPMAQALSFVLGVHIAIGSELRMDDDDTLTGDIAYLMDPEEKTKALPKYNIAQPHILAAFGDSASDIGILKLANHSFCLRPSDELRTIAEHEGWPILTENNTFSDISGILFPH